MRQLLPYEKLKKIKQKAFFAVIDSDSLSDDKVKVIYENDNDSGKVVTDHEYQVTNSQVCPDS